MQIHFAVNTYLSRPRDQEYFGDDKTDSRIGHPYHVDSGDVTANVCLGDIFEGGAVNFRVPSLWDPDAPPVSKPTQETSSEGQGAPTVDLELLSATDPRDRTRDREVRRGEREERLKMRPAGRIRLQRDSQEEESTRPRDEGARKRVTQKVGSAMLHPAQLLHSSDHLISGQRFNFIRMCFYL